MRTIKPKKIHKAIMDMMVRNYTKAKELCSHGAYGMYGGEGFEDIFHDTVLYVVQDDAALPLTTDEEFIRHFLYRYNMIKYQRIMDDKQRRETDYADYKQIKGETEEE